jgi:hypothetical protein
MAGAEHIKEKFHLLIDRIEDQELVKVYYELVQMLNQNESGKLWNDLTEDEKNELLVSYEESKDPNNLISHDLVKKQHSEWLKK